MTDLILHNANVITMEPASQNAQLVAIKDGKILSVGRDEDLRKLKQKNTEVINCKSKTILPGFIDTHCHLLTFAGSFVTLNLNPQNDVGSISNIQAKIRQLSQEIPPGTWIRGRGYNEFSLTEKRHPTRWDLDKAAANHPVKITHRSGRAHVLNSFALKLVGISKETPDPPDGLINRHLETGEPTGLLYSMGDYLSKIVPPIDHDQMEHGTKLANAELCSFGITSIHDASPRNNFKRWEMFSRWKKRGLLKPRISMILGLEGFNEYRKNAFSAQVDVNQLSPGGVKIIVHETTGRLNPSQEELNEMVFQIHRFRFQAVLHAIEERTIEAACSAIEYALKKIPRSNHRHRIEHCSVCTPSMAKRLASLGIMIVTQPSFLYYNGERYLRTVPRKNLMHLYPIATLMKKGAKVAGSSDCPAVPVNPLIGIYSAVYRKTETGETILPQEGISPLEALRMYTYDAAKTTFEEKIKGSIVSGKLADLVVLNGDPTKDPADEIKVQMTIINGEIVWDKIT